MKDLLLSILVCSTACAQSFEVASVKAASSPDGRAIPMRNTGGPGTKDPGRWTAENLSLTNLVVFAYGLNPLYQLNAPSWLNAERYNIVATVPEGRREKI